MNDVRAIEQTIRESRLFGAVEPESLASLTAAGQLVRKTRGQSLFLQDDPATQCFYIIEGYVKLFRDTAAGEENVLDVLSPGSLLGETSVFNNDRYSYSAEAVGEEVVLLALPLPLMRTLIKKDPNFCCQMLRHLGGQSLEKDKELERRTLQEASQRIGCFLLSFCKEISPSPARIELPYEKVLIARKLGMRPETFSRGLQKLQKDIDAEIIGMTVKIKNVEALSEYTCASCSYALSCEKSASASQN